MIEEWKNVIVDGKVNNWYSISNYGRCVSHIKLNFKTPTRGGCVKTIDPQQYRILKPVRKYQNPQKKDIVQCATHSFAFPSGFFEDYDYVKLKGGADGNIVRNCKLHRLVMEAFKPLDQFPPARLRDDWDIAPQSFIDWVRETALVNHIDHNPDNNHIDNLEWMTPRENTRAAIKMYGRMENKNKILVECETNKPNNILSKLLGV